MAKLSWREAIIQVLTAHPGAMHYAAISDAILAAGHKSDVGATPAQTVNATITSSIKQEKDASPFVRVETGRYALRASTGGVVAPPISETGDEETGLINAFGMFWSRSNVLWMGTPRLLGSQGGESKPVDFCGQQGVYLLHDRRDVVYVGRTTDQALGLRLLRHDADRLSGRWERFSWFGVFPVHEDGRLNTKPGDSYDLKTLIITMEALLIEGLEPPQNRKRGDGFGAVEYIQVEDESIQRKRALQVLDDLKSKL